jgi:hypothetical protein
VVGLARTASKDAANQRLSAPMLMAALVAFTGCAQGQQPASRGSLSPTSPSASPTHELRNDQAKVAACVAVSLIKGSFEAIDRQEQDRVDDVVGDDLREQAAVLQDLAYHGALISLRDDLLDLADLALEAQYWRSSANEKGGIERARSTLGYLPDCSSLLADEVEDEPDPSPEPEDEGPEPGAPSEGQRGRQIGRETSAGDYATAVASGNATSPKRMWVRVEASPEQGVDVFWSMVCSRGFGAGSKDGEFSGQTPLQRAVGFPMQDPDDCTLSASAQLSGSGRLEVILLAA